MSKKQVLAFSGSTRARSTNEQILHHIAGLYADKLEVRFFDPATLPFFQPEEAGERSPASVVDFCRQIERADGVLICTPEYVFSLPGVLKNALEWTVATTVFTGKPTALITASAHGAKAHESLLLIMQTLQAKIGTEAALLIPGAKGKVNAQGEIVDFKTREGIIALIASFLASMQETASANR
ncbi:MAG: NADPH-dependent FMN reductase [Adhaeribacter sp.]